MKRCPKCNQTYDDASLNFCLTDGAPLLEIGSEPTVVIPKPPAKKKGRLLLWLGLAVVVIVLGVVGLAAILLFQLSGKGDILTGTSPNTAERQPGPSTPRPKPTPSPTPAIEEEPEDSTSEQPDDGGSDEVTPIAWETTAGGFKGEAGRTYTFQCPSSGTAHAIFGSDIYTDYSSICTAAVHAGVIDVKNGGVVTIEYRPGRQIYGSTVRNTVKSNTAGEYSRSFVIRKDAAPAS
jgi:uncharacterized cupin superfamily protein